MFEFQHRKLESRQESRKLYEQKKLKILLSNKVLSSSLILIGNKLITDLGEITYIKGNVSLTYSSIKSLSNLKQVTQYIDLDYSDIEDLGNLEIIGGFLSLENCKYFKDFKKINFIGTYLYLSDFNLIIPKNIKFGRGKGYKRPIRIRNGPVYYDFESIEEYENERNKNLKFGICQHL